jgi:hypothetical protein
MEVVSKINSASTVAERTALEIKTHLPPRTFTEQICRHDSIPELDDWILLTCGDFSVRDTELRRLSGRERPKICEYHTRRQGKRSTTRWDRSHKTMESLDKPMPIAMARSVSHYLFAKVG